MINFSKLKLWYNALRNLEKETIKESGKFFLDISKIIIAIAVITPVVKGGGVQILPLLLAIAISGFGLHFINKGVKK